MVASFQFLEMENGLSNRQETEKMLDTNKKNQIEKEIYKQIDQFDERVERSGWFYIVLVTGILFIVIGSFMFFSKTTPNYDTHTIDEMNQRIIHLEDRINELESKLSEKE